MDQLLAMRVFVRIAEAGTFFKAADSLNLPRSTVTKLVQELEGHLGVKLLQRTTRRVSVTPEGAAYHERATRLLAEVEDMDGLVAHQRAQPKGRLRVDIGSSLANLILLPALPQFRTRYPDIQIDVGVSDRPADLIGEGVDCVFRGGALAESSLVARRIAELDFVTCASPVYIEKYGTPSHPSDLEKGHVLCSYASSLTGRSYPLYFKRREEVFEIQGRAMVSVNESTAHLTGLLVGLGIGQVPKFMAQPHVKGGALVTLFKSWTRPRHPLHVVYPPNRHLNAKVRVFVDWSVEVFGKFDDRPS